MTLFPIDQSESINGTNVKKILVFQTRNIQHNNNWPDSNFIDFKKLYRYTLVYVFLDYCMEMI